MQVLKAFCLVFCSLSLLSVFTGVHAIRVSYVGNVVTRQVGVDHSLLSIILSLANALLLAAAFYGIHKRALIAWRLGFAVIVVTYIIFLNKILSITLNLPQGWVPALIVGIASFAICFYGGVWWKGQKEYFSSSRNSLSNQT
jgi:hypothetical protein